MDSTYCFICNTPELETTVSCNVCSQVWCGMCNRKLHRCPFCRNELAKRYTESDRYWREDPEEYFGEYLGRLAIRLATLFDTLPRTIQVLLSKSTFLAYLTLVLLLILLALKESWTLKVVIIASLLIIIQFYYLNTAIE